MRVLLTGFGPFPGRPENRSAEFVRAARLEEHEVVREVLRTSFQASEDWALDFPKRFDRIVHLGVASSGYRLETCARNQCTQTQADADGCCFSHAEVVPGGEARLDSTFPVADAVAELARAGFSVAASDDAGSYVCNFLYYRSLLAARRCGVDPRIVFLHVPPDGAVDVVDALLELAVAPRTTF
jgi:pyroglutamyl-peptidase